MTIWLREVVGWVLLGTGLAAFTLCYFVFLLPGRIVEGAALVVIGVIVFRGGMHLLKVAMAAQAALEIRQPSAEAAKPTELRLGPPRGTLGRGSPAVVPGAKGQR